MCIKKSTNSISNIFLHGDKSWEVATYEVMVFCYFIFARCMVSTTNAKGSMVMLMHGDIAQMSLTILHFQLL